jgi:hypothetical protein
MKFNHIPLHIPDLETSTINNLRYYHCGDNKYPSITSVLSAGEPKEYLKAWRERLGDEAAAIETKRCADRGTSVHLLCEHYLNNQPLPEVTELDRRLFNKIKLLLGRAITDVRAQECALYSDVLSVAGRCDCIANYNGKLSIIDFKTANNNKTEEMIADYYLQATFYALALLERTSIEVEQIVIIIAVESQLAPQVFIKHHKPYIVPLIKKINTFYSVYSRETQ